MKILVTGGAGYIGSILCEKLLERGYEVVVFDRLFFGDESLVKILNNPRFKLIIGDIRDREMLERAMYGADAVIHLAAIVGDPACAVDVELAISVNFNATITAAELAKKQGIEKFIFASTCSVYGANQEIVDEESDLNPLSLYAQTRLYGERGIAALKEGSFQPVILRFGTVYGLSPRMRFDLVVNYLIKKLFAEGRISIFGGGQWRPLSHVADIAKAIVLSLEADSDLVGGEVFNVGTNEHNYQLGDLIPIYQRLSPKVQVELVKELEDNRSYRVNFDKIKHLLNFTPDYSVEVGIREIYDSLATGQLIDLENFKYYNIKTIEQLKTDFKAEILRENADTMTHGSGRKRALSGVS